LIFLREFYTEWLALKKLKKFSAFPETFWEVSVLFVPPPTPPHPHLESSGIFGLMEGALKKVLVY